MAPRAKPRDRQSPTAFPSALPSPHAGDTGDHPELDCLRRLLPAATLAWAAHRAERLGMGADRALIAAGAIDEETYLRALAADIGIAFAPLDDKGRADCPLDDRALVARAAAGLLPVCDRSGTPLIVVAPRALAARGLIRLIRRDPAYAAHLRLTTSERINRFALRAGGPALVAAATGDLAARWPMLAAKGHLGRRTLAALTAIAALLAMAAIVAPTVLQMTIELLLAAAFMAWLSLRLTGAFIREPPAPPERALPDRALPVYTIIAALYREAGSVAGLLAAIERLDYPPEKLDVIVAVEADDSDTRAALAATRTRFPITVIPVPPQGPRTKPKALNVALPFARGAYTVIYDAEDRPEPGQLRDALQAFLAGPADLACVQARLSIDNTDDSWLAGYYTAEYAGQFDVFMPGLAALGLPLPLGGSSNHFHTATLRKTGAWDPFNVTEDADLGMRLSRFGYRTGMIRSTTYEEAPARAGPWLRQRTRWFKGWMQTWLVHMREPMTLFRQLGPAGFVAFHLMVGGNVLAALVHPLFVAALIAAAFQGGGPWSGDRVSAVLVPLYSATAVFGYLSSAAIGWLGLSRRGLLSSGWVLLLTPLHWMLLSLAAWRALHQLFTAPFAWEKTEHGLARSSRRAARVAQALADLDRDLGMAKDGGHLPKINEGATGTSADRRPPLAASA
jgi:cellulose synthase/poly-beta-1,6-N-acetylglucosamine synthase-like glycosyltransferase